jgi:hypothetical protein
MEGARFNKERPVMGTRNLTCVVLDGSFKIAQYGQWDGYPSGQGATCLAFLQELAPDRLETFKANLRALPELSHEEIKARWKSCGANDSGFVSFEIADKFKAKWPHLNRDCGAEILETVLHGKADGVELATSFANDSLFCEWAYLIDLDKQTFEVYRGFNQSPLDQTERFYSETPDKSGYYPVRMVKSYPLDALPKDVAQLAKDCDPPDEPEEDQEEGATEAQA